MFRFLGFLSDDLGIDLGTANMVVYASKRGIVFNQPSVLATRRTGRKGQKEILAVGAEAKCMIGKTPAGVDTIRPLQHGVIADFEMTELLIKYAMDKAVGGRRLFSHPRAIVSVPACVTEVEKKAVVDATLRAGAREAMVVEEPLVAALGAGLPINEPRGNMIVDIGGGTSEVAVLSLGGIVVKDSIRMAGDEMDNAIVEMMKQNYALSIGQTTAEEIKLSLGSAVPLEQELQMEVKGRDLMDGLPKVIKVTSTEVREALSPIIEGIEEILRNVLERTPPELVKDIVDQGLVLTGGGANLRGLNIRLADSLNVPVHLAEQPLFSVALGLGRMLKDRDFSRKVFVSSEVSSL
ncbi:cell shape determining protein, MreB/Mrl family [Thermanaerovibrio velox DSM 12556]|uniref:Cell shape-determining protein MreB n=1 Tax=Thermanaerovibrio velox DSM 12556 TaxID=926567 RepID=H0UQG0_9BACT|nr:rod shape-determining protein [Thermanaerovibrio velox]EHM09714.1 cell shape determining protein, MreB/Mrl family [Thermanaerovibrio velox DSM 12556]